MYQTRAVNTDIDIFLSVIQIFWKESVCPHAFLQFSLNFVYKQSKLQFFAVIDTMLFHNIVLFRYVLLIESR